MPTLKIRFPGGRYHATPWGHHVNEGLIEWPPCPWRLLRAFVACGFTSQGWTDVPPVARQLIDKLATVLPLYRLPEASAAHSRHYMPTGKLKKGREDTTLVFDTWANVGDGELLIHWPCELNGDEAELFNRLASSIGYLGRSESWVEAEMLANGHGSPKDCNAFPCNGETHQGREYEQISLIAAVPSDRYREWQQQQMEKALTPFPLPEGKKKPTAKLRKDRKKATDPYPSDLLSCLIKDTAWWKGYGWSQPPGSQRVLYWRRSDALQVGVPTAARPAPAHAVTTMLLAITTASGNRSALPPVSRTLPQAELFHRAIVGRLAKGNRVTCPELTGKNDFGQPLHGHKHAHTIPVDWDGDGHLDHIVIYAAMGLREAAQRAIRTLRRTWTKGGAGDLQIAVAGSGDLGMLRQLPQPFDLPMAGFLGPSGGAKVWESITPFVPPRYLKSRGKNTLLGQISAELASRGFPAVEQLEALKDESAALRHFVRRRQRSGNPPPIDAGFALRLVFKDPITGPLCLGYASHFGLGRFQSR